MPPMQATARAGRRWALISRSTLFTSGKLGGDQVQMAGNNTLPGEDTVPGEATHLLAQLGIHDEFLQGGGNFLLIGYLEGAT